MAHHNPQLRLLIVLVQNQIMFMLGKERPCIKLAI